MLLLAVHPSHSHALPYPLPINSKSRVILSCPLLFPVLSLPLPRRLLFSYTGTHPTPIHHAPTRFSPCRPISPRTYRAARHADVGTAPVVPGVTESHPPLRGPSLARPRLRLTGVGDGGSTLLSSASGSGGSLYQIINKLSVPPPQELSPNWLPGSSRPSQLG